MRTTQGELPRLRGGKRRVYAILPASPSSDFDLHDVVTTQRPSRKRAAGYRGILPGEGLQPNNLGMGNPGDVENGLGVDEAFLEGFIDDQGPD
jgi:hypothetical protein